MKTTTKIDALNKLLKTEIRNGIETANREEFQAACRAAGRSWMWGLLNVPTRKVGSEWPEYAKSAALKVGAILPE
jgi:hypothetical protein